MQNFHSNFSGIFHLTPARNEDKELKQFQLNHKDCFFKLFLNRRLRVLDKLLYSESANLPEIYKRKYCNSNGNITVKLIRCSFETIINAAIKAIAAAGSFSGKNIHIRKPLQFHQT
jgi:hypothetical protein